MCFAIASFFLPSFFSFWFCRSQDGKYIATGGSQGILRLWEIHLPHEVRFITEVVSHSKAINSVAFSLNDKQIVSGGDDGSVFIWSVFVN
jgi:WD40 repeat protein